jgi:hypothetical protein
MRRLNVLNIMSSTLLGLSTLCATPQSGQRGGAGVEAGVLPRQWAPARLALRDFTIWPVCPEFPTSAAERAAFAQREHDQTTQMWNQPQ